NNTVFSVASLGDGSGNVNVYVGGAFTSYNGTVVNDLVRLQANGTVDPAFATGTGFNNTVFSIAPAGDKSGNLYVGGQFTSYQSITIGRIARLKSNGSVD
ncbi:MAG TPA: delta-60 repeat domain-containing protein, partial [Nitrospiraceae bacterium]|nr:delta-60 repeat domain-containing protein [Nitrospiraceae bacterium]